MTIKARDIRDTKHTSFIDLFRGIAALWVVASHCQIWMGAQLHVPPDGRQAVDVFFVISGFLMTMTTDDQAVGTVGRPSWTAFYIRRFFRIAPTYYVCLLCLMLVWQVYLNGFAYFRSLNPEPWASITAYDTLVLDARNLFLHVTFLFGFSPSYSFSTMLPDWSLAVEIQFYAIFPFLYWLNRRASHLWLFVVAVAAMVGTAGYAWGVTHLGWHPFLETTLVIFRLQVLIAGMLLYEAGRSNAINPLPLILSLGLLVITYRDAGLTCVPFFATFGLMSLFWLAPSCALVIRASRSRIARFGAHCSYPAYLFHGFVLSLAGAPLLLKLTKLGMPGRLAAIAVSIIVIGLTYIISYGVHRCVEKPGMRLGKQLTERLLSRRLSA